MVMLDKDRVSGEPISIDEAVLNGPIGHELM